MTQGMLKKHPWLAAGAALVCVVLIMTSCHDEPAPFGDDGIPADWPRPQYDTAQLEFGGETITVELADTPERRAYGYMFVREVKPGHGMIFIYPEKRPGMSFWMRNTRVSLDLLYLDDDGRIVNIHQNMKPRSDEPGYPAAGPCRFVLELPGGWIDEHGVWMKDRVRFSKEILELEAEDDVFGRENIPDVLGQAADD